MEATTTQFGWYSGPRGACIAASPDQQAVDAYNLSRVGSQSGHGGGGYFTRSPWRCCAGPGSTQSHTMAAR